MRTNILFALPLAFLGINAQNTTVDLCPKTEHACLDVINSSLCLSQNAALGTNGTKDAMAACVTFAQSASNISGAAKLCRCPGCHSASINAVIAADFPPPCSAY